MMGPMARKSKPSAACPRPADPALVTPKQGPSVSRASDPWPAPHKHLSPFGINVLVAADLSSPMNMDVMRASTCACSIAQIQNPSAQQSWKRATECQNTKCLLLQANDASSSDARLAWGCCGQQMPRLVSSNTGVASQASSAADVLSAHVKLKSKLCISCRLALLFGSGSLA